MVSRENHQNIDNGKTDVVSENRQRFAGVLLKLLVPLIDERVGRDDESDSSHFDVDFEFFVSIRRQAISIRLLIWTHRKLAHTHSSAKGRKPTEKNEADDFASFSQSHLFAQHRPRNDRVLSWILDR